MFAVSESKKNIKQEIDALSKLDHVKASLEILKDINVDTEYFKLLYVFFNRLSIKAATDNKNYLMNDIETYKMTVDIKIAALVNDAFYFLVKKNKIDTILDQHKILKKNNRLINDKINKIKEEFNPKELLDKIDEVDMRFINYQKNDIKSKIRYSSTIENLQKNILNLNEKLENYSNELGELMILKKFPKNNDSDKKIKDYDKNINKISNKLNEINLKLNEKYKLIEEKINNVESINKILKNSIENLKLREKELNQINLELTESNQKFRYEINTKITQLFEDNNKKTKKLKEKDKIINKLKDDNNIIKKEVSDLKELIEKLNNKIVVDKINLDNNIDSKIDISLKFKFDNYLNSYLNMKIQELINYNKMNFYNMDYSMTS